MQKETYSDLKASLESEQADMTPDEVRELMRKRSDYLIDLDRITPQEHRWIDRGVVVSCEGAGHPNHRVFKRAR